MAGTLDALKVRPQCCVQTPTVMTARRRLYWRGIASQVAVERVILDPRYHDVLTVVKGARNGAVYGTKVRFPHALVYVLMCH
jgi:hypothetical protein